MVSLPPNKDQKMNTPSTDTSPAPRKPRSRPPRAREGVHPGLPAYGVPDGGLSFRAGLCARERQTIDRALSIVARTAGRPGAIFESPSSVKDYLTLQLAGEPTEVFGVLFLDVQMRLICFEAMFRGSLTQTSVYPREVVRAALAHEAASIVLSHNHPSGNTQPSRSDEHLTQTMKAALALVDVRVLDHVIVAPGVPAFSMAECGLI